MKPALLLFSALVLHLFGTAQIKLPRLVRDSMVLQRDTRINLWGWAGSGEQVSIQFNGKKVRTKAGTDGKWTATLPPMKAGGPYTMELSASNKVILKDILIGDVWLCSGQSNMVHNMGLHSETYGADIAAAHYPQIRQFWIPTLYNLEGPQQNLPAGSWKSANPEDVKQFSVAAYFFARQLYEQYKIPIGIINASVGGSPVEAWTSEAGLQDFGPIAATIQRNKDTAYIRSQNIASARYNTLSNQRSNNDKGMTGAVKWFETAYQAVGWRPINIPGYWEDQGIKNLDGIVWYRREIEVPETMAGKTAKLYMGRIVDADQVFVNGKEIGSTGYQYPQRRYMVPQGLLRTGKNTIVVRVTNQGGKGGFVPDKPYYLLAGNQQIDLKGVWQYKVGTAFTPVTATPGISLQNQPTALYNSMIAPLVPYTLKGILWYQGESNAGNPAAYAKLFPAFIRNWRQLFGQGALPFLFVQLPNFMDADYLPAESGWAATREAQASALSEPNTAMAVAIDLGEWNDIHPDNKKDVGMRLARAAQKLVYRENIVGSGPMFEKATVQEDKIIISFTETGSGLTTSDGEAPGYFAIAGADKKFVWANTRIAGNTVVAWSDEVPLPLYVRYAWADNPHGANLYNKEGLPAAPFRTDGDAANEQAKK
ncbi:sialate O-acetylesterase [Cnuella takakiae]|uniref:Sialate O-acetylesterase n=1 Tax=Cnuella takakiae TaxID=1302690 RepID=A0A1M5BRV9_9BACT|nr:sialate O-acetylesterase [Cnuella takakiae]OLY93493.1 sialate O-acetylesterase [Cnuella takakiae]SHF45269.1 sialate O-acetylesterase [Cnuella takakiae]